MTAHQVELQDVHRALDPLSEDDSIVDLVTRVRVRHEANEEADRRLLHTLSTQSPPRRATQSTDTGELQVDLCSFIWC